MKTDKLRDLEKPLKQILAHKPESAPKKPEKQPSKAELEQVYRFDGSWIVVE